MWDRNLVDYLNTNVHSRLKEPISYDGLDRFPKLLAPGMGWIRRTGPASSVIVEGGGFFKSPGADRPDMQIHIAPATVVRGDQTRLDGNGFTINSTFPRPESVGSVKLASSDPTVEPLMDPQYLSAPRDKEMALLQVRTIREVLAQPEMARSAAARWSLRDTDANMSTTGRGSLMCVHAPNTPSNRPDAKI
ncbi:GMC oxidoreductase [Streptomyces sp. NPDC002577]